MYIKAGEWLCWKRRAPSLPKEKEGKLGMKINPFFPHFHTPRKHNFCSSTRTERRKQKSKIFKYVHSR